MSKFKFANKPLLGDPKIEVMKGIFHIGNIRKHPMTGVYSYYDGINNQFTAEFKDRNLDVLKERIAERYK